jgi:hypothetical protein
MVKRSPRQRTGTLADSKRRGRLTGRLGNFIRYERFMQERVFASRAGFLRRSVDNPNRFKGLSFFLPFVYK